MAHLNKLLFIRDVAEILGFISYFIIFLFSSASSDQRKTKSHSDFKANL